jgi:hypothetical protein
MPDSVSVPVPVFTSEPPGGPVPRSLMTPLTVELRLLPPTVTSLAPRKKLPAPAIEPALSLPSLFGPLLAEKSTRPPKLFVIAAFPPVLLSRKSSVPLLVILALPAVEVSWNSRVALLVMVALLAVLVLKNCRVPLLMMVALPAVLAS